MLQSSSISCTFNTRKVTSHASQRCDTASMGQETEIPRLHSVNIHEFLEGRCWRREFLVYSERTESIHLHETAQDRQETKDIPFCSELLGLRNYALAAVNARLFLFVCLLTKFRSVSSFRKMDNVTFMSEFMLTGTAKYIYIWYLTISNVLWIQAGSNHPRAVSARELWVVNACFVLLVKCI
jgi:hypothetical protein